MNVVSYCTVKENDRSGVDLNAQRAAVRSFVGQNSGEIVERFVEIDRGRNRCWPKLAEAIQCTKDAEGTLVIGKLDHLVRNAAFTAMLMESRVNFHCCDNSNANPETIHILAALAADETKRISERTKTALKEAKARGVKLGSAREGHWDGREDRRREGARKGLPIATKAASEARSFTAQYAYNPLVPLIIKMRREDELTLSEIAERINAEGHKTRAGLPFTPTMIFRLLRRAGE